MKTYRILTTLLLISVFLSTFQKKILAEISVEQTAEEYRLKGYEEQQKGHFDKALSFYHKALSLGIEHAAIYNDIGVIYEQLGLTEKAEENYLKALEIDPGYLPPYTNLAYFYRDNDKIDKAIEYFKERFTRADQNDPWKERIRQELYKIDPELQRQILQQEAQKLSDHVVQQAHEEFYLNVVRSEKHYRQGMDLLQKKQYDEATAEFDRALGLSPNNPKITKAKEHAMYAQKIEAVKSRTQEAVLQLEAGDLESAKKQYQEILAIIPDKTIPDIQ